MGLLLAACGDGSGEAAARTGPLQVTGGGSAQFRERGKDNSIEGYGHEANRKELTQAATDVHGYLVARVAGDYQAACAYLARDFARRLAEESRLAKGSTDKRCGASVDFYLPAVSPRDRYEMSTVDAGSLRTRGNTGFIFFKFGKEEGKLLMVREDGGWKIAANLEPTPLH